VADEILGSILRVRFAIDPAVTGKISFRSSRSAKPADLLASFEQALALSDIALIRSQDQFLLVPRARAKTLAVARPYRGGGVAPGYQSLVIATVNIAPGDVGKALAANGLGDLVVGVDDSSGKVTIAGSSRDLRAAIDLIGGTDRGRLDPAMSRSFVIRNSSAPQVAAELDQLLKGFDIAGVTVVPLARLNQLMIGTRSAGQMAQVEQWLQRLDVPASEESETIWRYKPRNLGAESLAAALTQLSAVTSSSSSAGIAPVASGGPPVDSQGAGSPSEASASLLGADLRIGVEKESNTLLVVTSTARWTRLRRLLEELDASPGQVLIEATVLEVTLNRAFRMGVDWSVIGSGGLSAISSRNANGAIAPVLPGAAITYLGGDVRAVIDALASKTHVEVVSSPKLLALDNHSASLQIGDQVPIVNQTSQGTSSPDAPIVSVTEYRDTGVILKIKPRINDPDSVTLDFSQEVSGVSKNTISDIDSPTIQQRRFQSQIVLRQGQTAALGGLMSTKRSRGGSGIPKLSELPGIGGLFGARNDGDDRTEIIVLLTAHILRTADQQDAALRSLRETMPGLSGHAPAPR
jgi:general secretion pathway protein D